MKELIFLQKVQWAAGDWPTILKFIMFSQHFFEYHERQIILDSILYASVY